MLPDHYTPDIYMLKYVKDIIPNHAMIYDITQKETESKLTLQE